MEHPFIFWPSAVILATSCLAQFWFVYRIGAILEARHPETYKRMYRLTGLSKLQWFALRRADLPLGDAELSVRTGQFQIFVLVQIASGAGTIGALMASR